MPEAALLTKYTVSRVIGASRLRRLLRAGWLVPVERNLFNPRDVHAAWKRLECRVCPPDRIEVARVRASEARNGRAYVKKVAKAAPPGLDAIEFELDFSAFNL
jgi:hypothetical protein